MTSSPMRFGKQDFRYQAEEDVYICPAGERLIRSFTTEEHGLVLHRYLTNVCQSCDLRHRWTTAKERRVTRWEHEHILKAVPRRLDEHPEKMRQRRETVEHPFGTLKARMGATHFLMKTLPRVAFRWHYTSWPADGGNQDITKRTSLLSQKRPNQSSFRRRFGGQDPKRTSQSLR
jgi:hypothetical protein